LVGWGRHFTSPLIAHFFRRYVWTWAFSSSTRWALAYALADFIYGLDRASFSLTHARKRARWDALREPNYCDERGRRRVTNVIAKRRRPKPQTSAKPRMGAPARYFGSPPCPDRGPLANALAAASGHRSAPLTNSATPSAVELGSAGPVTDWPIWRVAVAASSARDDGAN
jgi:hypothetical protein